VGLEVGKMGLDVGKVGLDTGKTGPGVSDVGTLPMPAADELDLVAVLSALGDPARLEIVTALTRAPEVACGHLLEGRMAKSTRSHHLRVLRESGVIATRATGTFKYSRLRRDDLQARFPGLLDAVLTGARPLSSAKQVGGQPQRSGSADR